MTQDPRSRADALDQVSPRHEQQYPSKILSGGSALQPGVKDILRTLAAHGAGTASTELAFDLVLHEIVEEAREATQATGAAIAWMRDGEMVCRATTGENAPHLGVRVDIRSGLAGACADSAQIQNCSDTAMDSRVNGEFWRQLGVRSMLIAPISMDRQTLGMVQLFSSQPEAFGQNAIIALQPFVSRSIAAWMEAQGGDQDSSEDRTGPRAATGANPDDRFARAHDGKDDLIFSGYESRGRNRREFSNAILLIAVLGVAMLLGLVLGWKWGREQAWGTSGADAVGSNPIVVATSSESSSPIAAGTSSPARDTRIKPGAVTQNDARIPGGDSAGGLVISQDGKVIYRSLEPSSNSAEYVPGWHGTRLLRRVTPEYPPEALARHVQGRVVLDVKVLGNGTVSEIVVRSGDPLLTGAAVKAVKQWQFQSAKDADVGERQTRVTIRFTLPAN